MRMILELTLGIASNVIGYNNQTWGSKQYVKGSKMVCGSKIYWWDSQIEFLNQKNQRLDPKPSLGFNINH